MEKKNSLQTFVHEKFGKIRTIIIDGKIWFVAVDVCKALDLSNTTAALSRLDDDEKKIVDLNIISGATGGGWIKNEVNVINEPGLYRLIFSSKKSEAKEFQRWVYHKVLPSIMKNSKIRIIQELVKSSLKSLLTPLLICVYAVEMSNGTVKIGKTKILEKRAGIIATSSGLTILNSYHTEYVHYSIAAEIEMACHRTFSAYRTKGEFFNITFAEACAELDKYADKIAEENRRLFEEKIPIFRAEYEKYLSTIIEPSIADFNDNYKI